MRRTQLLCFAMALLVPSLALADSIDPTSVTKVVDVGESFRITKTVTVDGRTVNSTDPIDVLFLFDTSASMQGNYNTADWLDGTIPGQLVSAAQALGGNVQMSVASYVDFPVAPWGTPGDHPYLNELALTSAGASVVSAMQSLTTGTGNDNPEANLHALYNAALDASIGWRAGSTRVILWFGDQPGHLPGEPPPVPPMYPLGYPGDANVNGAIAALLGADIAVSAFDFGLLDGKLPDPTGTVPWLDDDQATRITSGTGGDYFFGWWTSAANKTQGLSAVVEQALIDALFLYDVDLDLSDVPGGLNLAVFQDGAGSGDRRNGTQTYTWLLDFVGYSPATYSFWIDALVDGVAVAREGDRITVGDAPPPEIPEPSTLALLGLGLLGVGVVARRRKK